jgi:hypothetical protein
VVPSGKLELGNRVLVKLSTSQLSNAVGGNQSTLAVHKSESAAAILLVGQSEITGGIFSTSLALQQIGPPIKLRAFITVKLPWVELI